VGKASAQQPPSQSQPGGTQVPTGAKATTLAAAPAVPQKAGSTAPSVQPSAEQTRKTGASTALEEDLAAVYSRNRKTISKDLENYPILVRWHKLENSNCWVPLWWGKNGDTGWFRIIFGLLLMGILVSLGAPFWNDVLKGMMGVNNALNTGGKKTS
jgi:hypothetical protein